LDQNLMNVNNRLWQHRRGWIGLALLAGIAFAGVVLWPPPPDWEPAIQAFEAQGCGLHTEPGPVLFVGSSSIRFWDTLTADLAPVPVLNRGFGGAQLPDVLRYADRIILPCQPRAVVIYAGENDLGAWWVWPGRVADRFRQLVQRLRQANPDLPILLLAIKPSPYFAHRQARQAEANRLLRAYCEATPGLDFIDVARPLLDAQGGLRPELYRDGLHLNAAGYALWREQVRPALLALPGLSPESAGTGTAAAVGPIAPAPSLERSAPAPPAYSPRPSP
jgi:lysophospholipase L1-like esterase